MLQTLSQLGRVQDQSISSNIKHVIGIIFENKEGKIKYVKSELHNFNDASKYLYQRDFSGQGPGLFLTGNIPNDDIKKLGEDNSKFITKKILWFPHGKLVNNDVKLSSLSDYRQMELKGIFEQLQNKGDKIAADVIKILTSKLPEQTWLTIMIQKEDEAPKFVGQIKDYVDFFAKGVLSKKKNTIEEELVCGVCNKSCLIYPYAETPLPFFFSDKLHFFDGANYSSVAKGFPVCNDCYQNLGNGIKFVKNKLDYRVSAVQLQGKKQKLTESGIKFWLLPELSDYRLLERFKNDLGSKSLYYLDSLKELCKSLKLIQTADRAEIHDDVEAFLRFSALFYYTDKKAYSLMRIINYVPGIYPPQLRKLLEVAENVDNQYPFRNIRNEEFFVGLPLLVTFYKDIKPQWQSQIILILTRMFTGQQIPTDQIIQNINLRVHETLGRSKDLQLISKIALDGLILLEYLISLNDNESVVSEKTRLLMLNISTYEMEHTDRFIEAHKSVLNTETKKGIFAAGITVAIFFYVQEHKYGKSAPYWDKVGRLDLDLQKVKSLMYDVKKRLATYRNRDYDTIINYLAAAYTIDDPNGDAVSKDTVSYIFTLGLSFGYLLARRNLKSQGEEVKQQ